MDMVVFETVVQSADGEPDRLERRVIRVPAGTTVREGLVQSGHAGVVPDVVAGRMGLARHGRRTWLDQALQSDARIEVLRPVRADVRAQRVQRVQAERAGGRDPRWNRDRSRSSGHQRG